MTIKQLIEKHSRVLKKLEQRRKKLTTLMKKHIELRKQNKKVPDKLITDIHNLTHRSIMNKSSTKLNNSWKWNGKSWSCRGCSK
jgi:hypothetical protein